MARWFQSFRNRFLWVTPQNYLRLILETQLAVMETRKLILMNQQELEEKLTGLSTKLDKVSTEITTEFQRLKDALAKNPISPTAQMALASLETKINALDAMHEDASTEEPGTGTGTGSGDGTGTGDTGTDTGNGGTDFGADPTSRRGGR